ncbi:MAG: glycosyl transferase family 1 [Candidatus Altiarchaeales archaeon ex4484_2]|nr:MAG: glycosyl transferase family 1 [Candidatus Altiarchaeales archaeon ex4484_2]
MNILRVASDLYPTVVGGLGVHVHEMSKEQARLGYNVTVYTTKTDDRPVQEYGDGYKIVRFRSVVNLMGNSIVPSMFFKLINAKNDFDIVHAHSHLFLSTNLCAIVKKIGSPPLVITNHGLISQTVPMWVQEVYIPTIARWTFESADRILCYTEEEKTMLKDLNIDSEKIKVIHNGTDTRLFSPRENEGGGNQILWVGRFTEGKGVDYLIDAFSILVRERPNLKLLMVGWGPLKEDVKLRIRNLGLMKSIIIREFIPNTRLPGVYQNSDVFVLPSIQEGVPRTLLEAMASGVPVVCTELPQLVDVVDGCGLMVPSRDSQALADAISRILDDNELAQKLGKNGRINVVRNYSWEDTVKKTIEVYGELM